MFDVVFSFFEAWNLAGMLLMGGVFLLLGGGMAGYEIYWRMKARSIKGRISAVRVVSAQGIAERYSEEAPEEYARKVEEEQENVSLGGKIVGTFFVLLFLALPLVFIGIGAHAIYKYYDLTANGVFSDAMVVRYEESYDSDSGTSYYPVLEFRDEQGKLWEVKDSFGSSTPAFGKGEQIGVYYDKKDPERFVVDDFWHSVGTPMIFSGFGFVFLAVIGGIGFFAKRKSADGKGGAKTGRTGDMYYPVYEYQDVNGNRMEQVGSVGRNSLLGMLPGKEVRLLMFPDEPEKVRRPMTFLIIFGLIFLLPGFFVLYQAATTFEGSPAVFVMLLLIVGFIIWRIRSAVENAPKGMIKEVWASIREQRASSGNGFRMGPFSGQKDNMQELGESEIQERVKKQAGQAIIAGYVVLLIAVGLSVGSYYAGLDMLEITLDGLRAQGTVVDINSRYSSDSDGGGYTYYAVVAFKDASGNDVRFEDSVGSSHPLHKNGDRVTVLYNPENSGDVIIDRGIMNWGLSGGLGLGALLMLMLGINSIRQGRANSGMRYRDRI